MRRPILDIGAQAGPIAAQIIERLFLASLLVQRLGVQQFERWSLISATIVLLTMVDLGAQITFSNRTAQAAHAGREDEAVAIFRQSNSIFLGLAAIVLAATLAFAWLAPLQHLLGFTQPLDGREQLVALLLGATVAFKLAMTNGSGVYRANLAFGRGTWVITGGDLLRIGAGILALLMSQSMLVLAAAMAAATLIAYGVVVPADLARRFPRFAWRYARPAPLTTRGSLGQSILFAASFLPSIVLTQVPILLIGSKAASGVLAGYVLMRTIANTIRSLSQKVTFVLAMELSRLRTQDRGAELAIAYRRLSLIGALAFGCGCAFLWAWGDYLMRAWTGSDRLYDPAILAVMLAPLVLVPGTQLNLPLLTYGHKPSAFAAAVTLQTGGAALLAWLLPIDSLALRLTLALSLAEILLMAPIVAAATRKLVGEAVVAAAVPNLLVAIGTAAATVGLVTLLRQSVDNGVGLITSAAVVASLVLPVTLVLARRFIGAIEASRG